MHRVCLSTFKESSQVHDEASLELCYQYDSSSSYQNDAEEKLLAPDNGHLSVSCRRSATKYTGLLKRTLRIWHRSSKRLLLSLGSNGCQALTSKLPTIYLSRVESSRVEPSWAELLECLCCLLAPQSPLLLGPRS